MATVVGYRQSGKQVTDYKLSDGRTVPYDPNSNRLEVGANYDNVNQAPTPAPAPAPAPSPAPSPSPSPAPAPAGVPVDQYMALQVKQPTLPTGAEFTPVTMATDNAAIASRGEDITGANTQLNPTAQNIQAPQQITAPTAQGTTGQAQTVDPNAIPTVQPGQYDAATVGNNAAQGTAEQGAVNPMSTIQGQLEQLYSTMQNGQVPAWAQGSVRLANDVMAARNLGASTIGATAIQAAVQEQAFNIASKDAGTYFQMDLTNLGNRQQMAMQNLQNRQQSMLTDQAALNAAKQFNATSQQQVQQFMSQLVSQIQSQNADRTQAMSQFNASEFNKFSLQNAQMDFTSQQFNAQQQQAVNEFNATLSHQREMYNSQTQFAIEQSNVLWRRSLNTANTAAVNAAMQANVQNKFNLSSTALNNIWQQFRDEAQWQFTASENDKTRAYNAANAANNRQFINSNQPNQLAQAAGSFAAGLLF